MKKRFIVPMIITSMCIAGLTACTNMPKNNEEALTAYYTAADYNKTINMVTEYTFENDESSSSNRSESEIRICGNEMSFVTDSLVKSTKDGTEIANTIKAYVANDEMYYDINGSKVKEPCTVKNAIYMLGIDFALFDESYCDNISIKNENEQTTAVYEMNPDKVLLNWESSFFTLQYGLGITASQIQTIDHCTVTIVTKGDEMASYEIDFVADIEDGDGTVSAAYKTHMDFSDYGKTTVTAFENLDEYVDNAYEEPVEEEPVEEEPVEEVSAEEVSVDTEE